MTIAPDSGGAEQPRPFAAEPGAVPGGCGGPLLVGCAAAVVLLGVLLLVVVWRAGDWAPAVFRWSLEQVEEQLSERLPEELDDAERRRLAAAFDAAAEAVADGSADPAALQRLQPRLLAVVRRREPDAAEVRALIEALEEVAAGRPPALAAPAILAPPPIGGR